MIYKVEHARIQLFQIALIVRNVAYYCALEENKVDLNKNYWIFIYNNHMDIAVLEWCKIFGSDKEHTHWKDIVPINDHRQFRIEMLKFVGMKKDEWETYWSGIIQYRNQHLAHHDFSAKKGYYPKLEGILKSSAFYYQWLRINYSQIMQPQYPKDFMKYYSDYLEQAKKISKLAYDATTGFTETLL